MNARNGAARGPRLADPTSTGRHEAEYEAHDNSLVLLQTAEIDQQIATAKRYPRSVDRFTKQMLTLVTMNESVAKECNYALPRDGKTIEGPSARLAEIAVSTWGNCRAASRVINEEGDFVTAQGLFHDLESNSSVTFEVKRRIVDRNGRRYSPDMIAVTANAACSIALRNAVFKGIPKAFWVDAWRRAREVVMGDFETFENRRANMVKEFQPYGVSLDQICAVLELAGHKDITIEHLPVLAGMLTAIKDGDSTPEELFGATMKPGNGKHVKTEAETTGTGPAAPTAQTAPQPQQANGPTAATPATPPKPVPQADGLGGLFSKE